VKRSTERILTTHVGSLVRPPAILEQILNRVARRPVDELAFAGLLREAVREVVRLQAEVGIDIPSDGEFSKPSFTGYVVERLAGLQAAPPMQATT
jgi:5-methyltetrahydropteroyltriglutamate--homocysteine methyltransferase